MIFQKDITKKKTYLIKLGVFCTIVFLVFTALTFLIIKPTGQSRLFLILLLSALFLFYVYWVIRAAKNYNNFSIETFDDKMVLKLTKRNIEVQFSEIQEIISYPSVLDKNQLIINCGKWKAIALNSYIENFDELKTILFAIKPLSSKKGITRRVFDHISIVAVISAIIAGNIKNLSISIIFASIGLTAGIINVIRYAKSEIRKSQKISGIIIYSFFSLTMLFSIIMQGKIAKNFSYRKNLKGETVLMEKDTVSKYDKQGNQIYHKTSSMEEYYKYDSNNNLIYRKSKSGSYEVFYTYKNNLLVEKKYDDGCVYNYEYDENGNELFYSENNGDYAEWSKYDSNNNLIEIVDSDNFHQFFKYDENNNMIYQSNDNDETYTYTYDEKNLCVKTECAEYVMTSEYDQKGHLILETTVYKESSTVPEPIVGIQKIEYDEQGNQSYILYSTLNNDGNEFFRSEINYLYDNHNNILQFKSNDIITEYSYDYDKDGRILKSYSYSK